MDGEGEGIAIVIGAILGVHPFFEIVGDEAFVAEGVVEGDLRGAPCEGVDFHPDRAEVEGIGAGVRVVFFAGWVLPQFDGAGVVVFVFAHQVGAEVAVGEGDAVVAEGDEEFADDIGVFRFGAGDGIGEIFGVAGVGAVDQRDERDGHARLMAQRRGGEKGACCPAWAGMGGLIWRGVAGSARTAGAEKRRGCLR